MIKKTKLKTIIGNLRKYRFRIVSGILLLVFLFIAIIIRSGFKTASRPVSYLPEIQEGDSKSFPSGKNGIKLKNQWYELLVDVNGKIAVVTPKGEPVLSKLSYYASYEGAADIWGLKNISAKLQNDSTISISGEGPMKVYVNVLLTVQKNKPDLDINIKTHYDLNTIVQREALVASFDIPVSEVYKKNRQVDSESFDSEYWLQKQGVQFSNSEMSALIYNTPFVSSLQLITDKRLLFINLEYYLDHPFISIPYQEDEGERWIDQSAATYKAGDERYNNFSICFGNHKKTIPEIMLVPNGYLAGYVFTEHADDGTLKTNRAAYFGSEDISNAKDARGGFVGHKIPVTKSVFYTDPGGISFSSIKGNPDSPQFLDFLDQLQKTGNYDICLHTPDGYNSNRQVLEESIKFMKGRFNTSTWIDHGMFGGKINREAIVADGCNPNSEYYSADFWEKYNTLYFWNTAPELIRENRVSPSEGLKEMRLYDAYVDFWKFYFSPCELKELGFFNAFIELFRRYSNNVEMNTLNPNKGNAYPTPLYWQNITRTGNFYSWVTDDVKDYGKLSSKKVENEQKQLNKLVSDWGIFINHGYYIDIHSFRGFLSKQDEKIIINPYFDKILEHMAQMRDTGDLYITTIRDLLNYWILIENISFEYKSDGLIKVNNRSNEPINGLSLVIHANNVLVNGEAPKFRRVGDNTVFWFNIKAKDYVMLEIR